MNPNRLFCLANLIIVFVLFFDFSAASADNWGHWRGPTGNSVAENASPPTQWSNTKNVKWKVEIPGKGSGSPVVWEDKVFVVSAISEPAKQAQKNAGRRGRGVAPTETTFKIFCFNRATGEQVWEQTATQLTPRNGSHPDNNFASASPCTDGQHVYAHFGSHGLYCYTLDGEFVWKRDDFGEMKARGGFGEGSSPTIAGDKIIVPWDHEGPSSVYALNKLTGETIWKTERDEPSCWATPIVVGTEGNQQVVLNGQNSARGYDLESGEEIWRCAGQTERPCATPVASGNVVYVGSGHRGSFLGAFQIDGEGAIDETDRVVWSIHQNTPDIASPVLSDDRLFFHKAKSGIISCINAKTGKPHFDATRVPGISSVYASPVAAGGHVYLTGRNGTTVVIKDAKKFKIVATNSVGETVDATPAPVDNELFIRGEKHLFCIAESEAN